MRKRPRKTGYVLYYKSASGYTDARKYGKWSTALKQYNLLKNKKLYARIEKVYQTVCCEYKGETNGIQVHS